MINFASIFNQFRSQSGGINELLDQPSTTMGRLLDEQSFISEYKSGGPKIVDFMNYDRFVELIEFITVCGDPDDKKRSYKYPFNACELLSVESNITLDMLFPDAPLVWTKKFLEEVEVQVEEDVEENLQQNQKGETEAEVKKQNKVEEEIPIKMDQETAEGANVEKPQQKAVGDVKMQLQEQVQSKPVAEKKWKKVMKKVKIQQEKIVKTELIPLINKIMTYFQGEVNYTLAGYICKVLSMVFTKKPANFLKYFLQEKFVESVLNHAESRSVGELIIKVLTHESNTQLQGRKVLFHAMLKRLSANSEIYIMSNISSYLTEVIEKIAANIKSANKIPQFAELFFSLEVVTQVIKNVISDEQNVSVYNSPVLLTFLTSVPFVLPEDSSIVADFTCLLDNFIRKSCDKLTITSQKHPKVGLGRLKIIEILRFITKENILNTKEIIAESNLFVLLLKLFREYPLSSLLHNQIVKILEIALTEDPSSSLNKAIIKDNFLLNFIKEEVEEDVKIRSGTSVYKSRKGFIAHLINIASKLKEISETNPSLKNTIEDSEYSSIFQTFFEKEIFNSKKSLAGFSLKKDFKHEIKFQKQDIINAFATFLRKCPPPIFDEPEPASTDQHPDLIEQLQKELEENLSMKPREEERKTEEHKIDQQGHHQQEKEQREKRFWECPLEYDVEQLVLTW